MKYKMFITLLILFSFLWINAGSAEVLPKGIALKDENISWSAYTFITTFINDTTQNEIIRYFHLPNNVSVTFNNSIGNEAGMLTSDIVFYIDNEKKNFNEFYIIENYNRTFKIIQIKEITLNKSSDIKFKFNSIIPPDLLSIDKTNATVKFSSDFNLNTDNLFVQYIFIVPAVNAQNIKLNFQNSVLKDPNNTLRNAPVTAIYSTNKYIDFRYLFWNEGLGRQVVSDGETDIIGLNPNTKYIFINMFSIEYDAIKWDWILQAVVVAILLTITFYLGTLWQRKSISTERRKPPK